MKRQTILSLLFITIIVGMLIYTVKESLNDLADIEPYHGEAVVDNERVEGAVGLQKGDVAPNIQLKSLQGDVISLHDYRGQYVILNFWASWCGPCRVEMPHMESYYREYKEEHQVELLAVNLTSDERKGRQGIESFVNKNRLTFPILLDQEGYTKKEYNILQIPTTYILDQEGVIAYKIMGPLDEKKLIELMEQLQEK